MGETPGFISIMTRGSVNLSLCAQAVVFVEPRDVTEG